MVTDVDQLILVLSTPQVWDLERNISGFELESMLIIMFGGLMDSEKREDGLQVVCTC